MIETDISKVLIEGDIATIMGVKYKRVEEPKECTAGYKVTFCVKFNSLDNVYNELNSPEDFGDYLANDIANTIIQHFDLTLPTEDVSGFIVEEMTDQDKEEWKDFWVNEQ